MLCLNSSFPTIRRRVWSDKPANAEAGATGLFTLGAPALDKYLRGGLRPAALHEVYASSSGDCASAVGFVAALACRATLGRPLCWVWQDFAEAETGALYPLGLAQLGLEPERVVLVRARNGAEVLRAGAEAARCSSLGAVVIAPWGVPRAFDLTASRRLSLRAEASGVTVLLLRLAAPPQPSAAQTRWNVRAAPSIAQAARSPGFPNFHISLLRHRGGVECGEWRVEWSHERKTFDLCPDLASQHGGAPLSRPLVSFSANRSAAPGTKESWRRAG